MFVHFVQSLFPVSRHFPFFLLGEAGHNSSRNLTDKSKAASSGLLFLPPFSPRKKMGGGGEECRDFILIPRRHKIYGRARALCLTVSSSPSSSSSAALSWQVLVYMCAHTGERGGGTKDLDAKSLFFFGSGFSRKK